MVTTLKGLLVHEKVKIFDPPEAAATVAGSVATAGAGPAEMAAQVG
jgi:hypothetical protein